MKTALDVLACLIPLAFYAVVFFGMTANARREARERRKPTAWAWRPREYGGGIVECDCCGVRFHESHRSAVIYPRQAPNQRVYVCPKCPDDDRTWSAAEAEKLMHARLPGGRGG